ncbi:MAG: hypothetical protein CMC93_00945 [Flavobacteriaceae bacterium]|nr:hypothetical protein [Flavobacteriaceae bacterium]
MWAEEATIHLKSSFNCSKLEMLFFIPTHEGYFCLNRNLVIIFANLFPLKLTALITTVAALCIQVTPHVIILCSKNNQWGSLGQRFLLSSAIILIPIGTGEIWLNSTCSHYHFGVLAFIICIDLLDSITKFKIWAYTILLCIGALSSPISCFLYPFLLYTKLKFKFKIPNSVLFTFGICCLLQFFISIIFMTREEGLGKTRFESYNIHEFPSILINDVIIKTFFGDNGLNFSLLIVRGISKISSLELTSVYWLLLFCILFIVWLIFRFKKHSDPIIQSSIFCFFVTFAFLYLSVGSPNNLIPRNAFLPGVILIFIAFLSLKNSKSKLFQFLILIFFCISTFEYFKYDSTYYSRDWPDWSSEIEKWEVDNDYQVKVWPRKNSFWFYLDDDAWTMSIPPK